MSELTQTLVGVAVALLLAWVALVVVPLVVARDRSVWPRRPGSSRTYSGWSPAWPGTPRRRGVRVRLWLLLTYLALPNVLIPDFVPLLAYADAAIVVLLVLRSVVAHAGTHAVVEHRPRSPGACTVLSALWRPAETAAPTGAHP